MKAFGELNSKFQEASGMTRYLDIFRRHDLSKLADTKQAVEPRVNNATKDVFDSLGSLLSSIVILVNNLSWPFERGEIRTVELKIRSTSSHETNRHEGPKWYVVSNKNLEEFLERIENESGTIVFAHDAEWNYSIQSQVKRYVKKQKDVVYYRTVTDPDDERGRRRDSRGHHSCKR